MSRVVYVVGAPLGSVTVQWYAVGLPWLVLVMVTVSLIRADAGAAKLAWGWVLKLTCTVCSISGWPAGSYG